MTDHEITGLAEAQATRDEVQALGQSFTAHVRRALFLWVIRWTIGFGLIWIVTAWTGRFEWLWTIGGVVALVSPALSIGAQWFIQKKIRQTAGKLSKLEDTLRESHLHEADWTDEPEKENGKL